MENQQKRASCDTLQCRLTGTRMYGKEGVHILY